MKVLRFALCLALLTLAQCKDPGTHHYGAAAAPALLSNPWWNTSFVFDPGNTSGCASDFNTGTSATCTSNNGPLKTYRQATYRWGGCPYWTADVTYTWISDQPDGSDPVAVCGTIGLVNLGGGSFRAPSVLYTGQLIVVANDTLNTVTSKNYATPQDLRSTFTSGLAYAAGDLVQNNTHSSMAILRTHLTNPNIMQPVTPLTIPRGNGQGWQGSVSEVDTWTSGDSVTVYRFPAVTVVTSQPTIAPGYNSNGMVQFAHMYWPDWGAAATAKGSDPTTLYIGTDLGELWSDRAIIWNLNGITAGSTGAPNSGSNASMTNVFASGGMLGGNLVAKECFDSGDLTIFAGGIITNNNQQSIQLAGTFIDGDTVFSPGATNQLYFNGVNLIGSVEFIKQANLVAGAVLDLQIRSSATGTNRAWGSTGILNGGYGRVTWSPSSTATTALGNLSSGIKLENGTTACSVCGTSTVTVTCGIALNVTNLDAACSSTGFGGTAARALLFGGGSFTSSTIGP